MDFATEDGLRDRAYSVWRQLSVEPPVDFTDMWLELPAQEAGASSSFAAGLRFPQGGASAPDQTSGTSHAR